MIRTCPKCGKTGSDTGELTVWECDCEQQKERQSQFMEDNWRSMRQYLMERAEHA